MCAGALALGGGVERGVDGTGMAQTEPDWDILLYCRGSTLHFGTMWHKSATRATHASVHRRASRPLARIGVWHTRIEGQKRRTNPPFFAASPPHPVYVVLCRQ